MRTIVFLATLLFVIPLRADPVKVAETDDASYYLDPASIGTGDAYRRVPVIHDHPKQAGQGARSRTVVYEVDCIGQRLRSVAVTEYPEPMAKGRPLAASQRESEWLYVGGRTGSSIAVRTPYWSIVRFVCTR